MDEQLLLLLRCGIVQRWEWLVLLGGRSDQRWTSAASAAAVGFDAAVAVAAVVVAAAADLDDVGREEGVGVYHSGGLGVVTVAGK